MVLKVFTRGDGPSERETLELTKRIEGEGIEVQYYDLDEDNSYLQAELYNIYSSPALVVTQSDGKFVEGWQNEVPLESEVKNFLRL